MIYTSYFAQLRNLPPNVIPISICGKAPEWYQGAQYKKLAPEYGFFSEWKKTHDNNYYIEHFNAEVLSKLQALRVVTELHCLLPYDVKVDIDSSVVSNKKYHIALICYEKPSDFCHRHLVAQWLTDNGYPCEEWTKNINNT